MTDLTAGALKKLNKKELRALLPKVEGELRYLIERIIESKSKPTGFGIYTDPREAGKKGNKARWAKEKTK